MQAEGVSDDVQPDIDTAGFPKPARIRAARDLRMLTQRETVDRMRRPVTPAALSQIEAGKVRPTADTLQDLADALGVPRGFLVASWSDTETGDVLARIPYFRDLAATPSRQRRRAGALALILSELVAALDSRVRFPSVSIPNFSVSPGATRDEIDEVADALRGEWNLQHNPIPHVVREIERHGVPIARLYLDTNSVDAFSVRFTRRPIILLTNDKSNYVRSRFDAAHELGHLIMHDGTDPNDRSIERQAHNFAASFLFPADIAYEELPRRIDNRGWRKLAELKQTWGVSIGALIYRAHDLRIIDSDAYRNAMKYMSARGWRTSEPGDREMGSPETPILFERAIKAIEVEYNITIEEVIASAHLPMSDSLALINAAIDRRPVLEF